MDDSKLYEIRNRIIGCISQLQKVAIELREIAETELVPPTPDEFESIKSGDNLVPYHAQLAGVLNLIRFHVLEAGVIYRNELYRTTPKTWDRQLVVKLASNVERSLGYVVEAHYREPNNLPSLPGYKPWDEKPKKKPKKSA